MLRIPLINSMVCFSERKNTTGGFIKTEDSTFAQVTSRGVRGSGEAGAQQKASNFVQSRKNNYIIFLNAYFWGSWSTWWRITKENQKNMWTPHKKAQTQTINLRILWQTCKPLVCHAVPVIIYIDIINLKKASLQKYTKVCSSVSSFIQEQPHSPTNVGFILVGSQQNFMLHCILVFGFTSVQADTEYDLFWRNISHTYVAPIYHAHACRTHVTLCYMACESFQTMQLFYNMIIRCFTGCIDHERCPKRMFFWFAILKNMRKTTKHQSVNYEEFSRLIAVVGFYIMFLGRKDQVKLQFVGILKHCFQ